MIHNIIGSLDYRKLDNCALFRAVRSIAPNILPCEEMVLASTPNGADLEASSPLIEVAGTALLTQNNRNPTSRETVRLGVCCKKVVDASFNNNVKMPSVQLGGSGSAVEIALVSDGSGASPQVIENGALSPDVLMDPFSNYQSCRRHDSDISLRNCLNPVYAESSGNEILRGPTTDSLQSTYDLAPSNPFGTEQWMTDGTRVRFWFEEDYYNFVDKRDCERCREAHGMAALTTPTIPNSKHDALPDGDGGTTGLASKQETALALKKRFRLLAYRLLNYRGPKFYRVDMLY
jgi:hypothetical protein